MKHQDLTFKIIGCAMEVHRYLGNGFQEVIYQRALAMELEAQGIDFIREFEMMIFYKERPVGKRRVDFFIENSVMLEIKATKQLEDAHLAQGKNYLEAYNLEIGLLINFGAMSLEYKRLHNNRCTN
ncbi:GxxExxY protein [Persicobacter diffluens]|uniref:GxxExxY protein n=1 Tax=Persicobacter diffluens TaxID=981 RepID=A0AAN4W0N4_9BACT|nr:hypothetical protein PEDI_31030 [Persicobacter diffluens]